MKKSISSKIKEEKVLTFIWVKECLCWRDHLRHRKSGLGKRPADEIQETRNRTRATNGETAVVRGKQSRQGSGVQDQDLVLLELARIQVLMFIADLSKMIIFNNWSRGLYAWSSYEWRIFSFLFHWLNFLPFSFSFLLKDDDWHIGGYLSKKNKMFLMYKLVVYNSNKWLLDHIFDNYLSTSLSFRIAGRSLFNNSSNSVYLSCTSMPFIMPTTGANKTRIGQVIGASPARSAHISMSPLAIVEITWMELTAKANPPKFSPVNRAFLMWSKVLWSIVLILLIFFSRLEQREYPSTLSSCISLCLF